MRLTIGQPVHEAQSTDFGITRDACLFRIGHPRARRIGRCEWVGRCLRDNADAKVEVEIVTSYCTCMNNEMDDSETLSITAWEKTSKGKVAMAACDKKSGWDKK